MTRLECEKAIIEKLKEIHEIHKQYNPNADYLSMAIIHSDDGYMTLHNDYMRTDKKLPLDRSEWLERGYRYGLSMFAHE